MYEAIKIVEKLKNAYDASTMSCNKFADAIKNIKWDETFKADGEIYFVKGELIVTVENINPFAEQWKPSWIYRDAQGEF